MSHLWGSPHIHGEAIRAREAFVRQHMLNDGRMNEQRIALGRPIARSIALVLIMVAVACGIVGYGALV